MGRIVLKCPYYPKQSTDLMESLSKYQQHLHRIKTNNPKVFMEPQKTQIAKAILKNDKTEGNTILDFKIHYKTVGIKMMWCGHKNRHRSVKQSQEINSCFYDKKKSIAREVRIYHGEKVFKKSCCENWTAT